MGRRIWVVTEKFERPNPEDPDRPYKFGASIFDCQVLSFKRFLPRGPIFAGDKVVGHRDQSLVQVYTDPGGTRTLAVASIKFKDPRKVKQ